MQSYYNLKNKEVKIENMFIQVMYMYFIHIYLLCIHSIQFQNNDKK